SLYKLVIYFINNRGRFNSFLLSILELTGQYISVNITNSIVAIITKFNIVNKLGYFITNNAPNNNTLLRPTRIKRIQ
ncbi:hypothetical protein K432DRAFT_310845, partial [Lepidopterella palustris CBS 459.81]